LSNHCPILPSLEHFRGEKGFPGNLLYQDEADLNQDHILVAGLLSEHHDAAVLHRPAYDYNELEKDSALAA